MKRDTLQYNTIQYNTKQYNARCLSSCEVLPIYSNLQMCIAPLPYACCRPHSLRGGCARGCGGSWVTCGCCICWRTRSSSALCLACRIVPTNVFAGFDSILTMIATCSLPSRVEVDEDVEYLLFSYFILVHYIPYSNL